MRPERFRNVLLVATIAAAVFSPAVSKSEGGSFTGQFSLGLRSVDVDGADRKFREDINLEDGPRLFGLKINLVPDAENRKAVDRMELNLSNFGGDPFETMHFGMRKFGSYNLKYDRTKSDYFYSDLILPHDLASIEASSGGDFHTFDFERVRDRAQLDVDLSKRSKLTFGFDRYTKRGESTTTLDISRDEFELDSVVDESMSAYTGAFQFAWEKVTFVLEERVREYDNAVEIFLPGFSLGENTEDLASVDFFFLNQPYEYTSYEHTVRVLARPSERFDLRFVGSFQSLDLDVEGDLSSQGISFQGLPFSESSTGDGGIDRDLDQLAVEFAYSLSRRVALTGRARQQNLDQRGDFSFAGALNRGDWDLELTGFELGLQVAVSSKVTLAGGLVEETRDVQSDWTIDGEGLGEDEETDNTGYFASVAWRPHKKAEVTLDLESNTFDNPFTLASPTDRERYRLRARYQWENGLSLVAAHTTKDFENGNSGWNADTDQTSLRLNRKGTRCSASLGYSMVSLERAIDQTVSGGSREDFFSIFYEADSDFADGRFRCAANDRWTLGGNLRTYDGEGSFAVTRDDLGAYVEVDLGRQYLAHIGYRTIDYNENDFDFDDYDADILELSVGYRW